jgi:DNA-directed RNA polymerase subunit RPC12/RpoP
MLKIKCLKCGHEWNTKSKYNNVTCPNCQRKVQIRVLRLPGREKIMPLKEK